MPSPILNAASDPQYQYRLAAAEISKQVDIDPSAIIGIKRGGFRDSLPVDQAETMASMNAQYPWNTSNVQLEAFSSSANDAAGGSGCQSLMWEFVDASGLLKTGETALNGTTPVDLGDPTANVNIVMCRTANRNASNDGTITIREKVMTSRVHAQVLPGIGCSQHCAFNVPLGHEAFVSSYAVGMSTNRDMDVALYTNEPGFNWMARSNIAGGNGAIYVPFDVNQVYPEGTFLDLRVKINQNDNSPFASGYMNIFYWPKVVTR